MQNNIIFPIGFQDMFENMEIIRHISFEQSNIVQLLYQ